MAGFDDERKELVVGIIDCIRTYTWDKKLESWIKDRGKNKPTITSPRDYRNRFRVSMMQYVLIGPSPWDQISGEAEGQTRTGARLPQDLYQLSEFQTPTQTPLTKTMRERRQEGEERGDNTETERDVQV